MRLSLEELKKLPTSEGFHKKVFIADALVYKTSIYKTEFNKKEYNSIEEYISSDELCEENQLIEELRTWVNIINQLEEKMKKFFCPIVDYYFENESLITVMPKCTILSDKEGYDIENIEELCEADFLELVGIEKEDFYNILEICNIDPVEAGLNFNCGFLNDNFVIFDYGLIGF